MLGKNIRYFKRISFKIHNKVTPLSYLYSLHEMTLFMANNKLVYTLFFVSFFFRAFAQPGSFDASFSGKGLKKFSFKQNVASEVTNASVTDAQGNLYILGAFSSVPFVAKVLANGQLDPAFGTGGKATLEGLVAPNIFTAKAIALHPDGGIVLAGFRTTGEGSYTNPVIVKLTSSGAPDLTFNGNAVVQATLSGFYASFTAVHVLPATGDIIATGGEDETFGRFFVKKVDQFGAGLEFFNKDGGELFINHEQQGPSTCSAVFGNTLYLGGTSSSGSALFAAIIIQTGFFDTHFDDGTVVIDQASGNIVSREISSIAVTSANEVVLGGYTTYDTGNNTFLVYKLGGGGAVWTMINEYTSGTATDCRVTSLTLDPNNKALLGGIAAEYKGDFQRVALHVKLEDLKLDETFLGAGIQTFPGVTNQLGITGVSRLSNGTYLLVSSVADDVNVKKIGANGAPINIGTSTELVFGVGNADSYINDISIRKDGQIFVCGYYYDPLIYTDVPVLASLKSDGTLDPSFGGIDGADPGVINLNKLFPTAIVNQLKVTAVHIHDNNKILLAGSYFNVGQDKYDIFLTRLNNNGTLEGTFNNENDYVAFGLSDGYAHDIAVQKDEKILVYGYAYNGESYGAVLGRFNTNGTLDGSFSSGGPNPGIYSHPNTNISEPDTKKLVIKIQPADQKIVAIATRRFNEGDGDFMAFRLDDKGTLDPTFGQESNPGEFIHNFPSNDDDIVMALCLKPDGKIILGGFTQHMGEGSYTNYSVVQLTNAGLLDPTFGNNKDGVQEFIVNDGNQNHTIRALEIENNANILALGMAQQYVDAPLSYTVLRFNATGALDNTFSGRGHYILPAKGLSAGAALYNGGLYLAGGDDFPGASRVSAQLIKLKLGTGPVIRATNLQLGDLQKTFGDPDFTLRPVSNSPAPVQYSITHGSCATVNATTGEVTIKCVPLNPDQYIEIKAYQPAVSGFTEDDVFIRLNVAQAIPKIIFAKQGGLADNTILLKVIAESKGSTGFDIYSDPDNVLEFLGGGNVYLQKEGCAQVIVTIGATQNYLQGTAIASVCGYLTPVPPDAADDAINAVYSPDAKFVVNVLANDEGNTGTIVASSVDLDPSKAGIQTEVYPLGGVGKFTVDTLGYVTYIPFVGFLGSAEISYTIYDSQNLISSPAKIKVTLTAAPTAPLDDLKATELFTPNDDGLNDAFVIGYREPGKSGTLKIFDRNGQQLLTLDNYNNDWTGVLANGNLAESGIYYYVFQESNGRELKGVVELRR